jgi:cytoskeletal protein RodZ
VPVTGDDDDRDGQDPAEPPWHESTSKLLGASVAGLAAIALVVWGVMAVSRDEPDNTPAEFVDSTFSSSSTSDSTTSSTSTITTTRSIHTTEINPGDPALTPPPPASTSAAPESPNTRSRAPRTRESEDDEPTSTRRRPRLNETRSLYPGPN